MQAQDKAVFVGNCSSCKWPGRRECAGRGRAVTRSSVRLAHRHLPCRSPSGFTSGPLQFPQIRPESSVGCSAAGHVLRIPDLRAGLTLLRSRTRVELSGADLVVAPAMGDSGWMQPRKIPAFFEAGREAARMALPEIRRLIEA